MKTNSKFKKIKAYKANQESLRKKAINSGVNLIAPETIFLSKDTKFGKNVTINPYVVIGKKVRIGNNVEILSFKYIILNLTMIPIRNRKKTLQVTVDEMRNFAFAYVEKYAPSKQQLKTYLLKKYMKLSASDVRKKDVNKHSVQIGTEAKLSSTIFINKISITKNPIPEPNSNRLAADLIVPCAMKSQLRKTLQPLQVNCLLHLLPVMNMH